MMMMMMMHSVLYKRGHIEFCSLQCISIAINKGQTVVQNKELTLTNPLTGSA